MTAKIDGTAGLLQQYDYQTPTTGFSYTFAAGTTVLVMNPAGTLATGTITMPAAPADGMTITFSSTQQITALTVNANTGQSIVGNPTTMLAGGAMTFVYRLSNTTWYAQVSTAAVGASVTPSPAPVLNVYASPGTWTKPATVKAIKVTVVGGGGNGGSSTLGGSGTGTNGGGGGGGGGAAIRIYPAPSLPGPQPYTVGTAGNTSSFGIAPITVISATGGSAGGASTLPTAANTVAYATGGAGGVGSNGSTNIAGSAGNSGFGTGGGLPGGFGLSGVGGASLYGGGGQGATGGGGTNFSTTGSNGGNYGGGAAGGTRGAGPPSNPGTTPGGTGATGVVIVEEFY